MLMLWGCGAGGRRGVGARAGGRGGGASGFVWGWCAIGGPGLVSCGPTVGLVRACARTVDGGLAGPLLPGVRRFTARCWSWAAFKRCGREFAQNGNPATIVSRRLRNSSLGILFVFTGVLLPCG